VGYAIESSVLSKKFYRLNDGQCDSVPFGSTKFEGKLMLQLLLLNLLMSSQQEGHMVT
jgi:hypothetical protein